MGNDCPSVIDLALANRLLLPMVRLWEASLPLTGSDHLPITIKLTPPTLTPNPQRPHWADTDWEPLSPIIRIFQAPSAPPYPSPIRSTDSM